MKFKSSNRIALKLTCYIVLFSFFLVGLGICGQVYFDYHITIHLLVLSSVVICLIAGFTLIMAHLLISRHLQDLAAQLVHFDPPKPYMPEYQNVQKEKEVSIKADDHVSPAKMDAVGRLSSSFAHEFGNPLFGIRSVISDFYSRDNISEDDKQLLTLARDECDRMREMIKEFQKSYQGML